MRGFRCVALCALALIIVACAATTASASQVAALGGNGEGQLGNGTTKSSDDAVIVDREMNVPLTGVTTVAAGNTHSLALLEGGEVYAWGENRFGQLGHGEATNSTFAVPVEGLTHPAVAVSAGYDYSLALLNNNTVEAWGVNVGGQLGDGEKSAKSLKPVKVEGLEGTIVAISAGEMAAYALNSEGQVFSWGENRYGELGNGEIGPNRLKAGRVELPEKATAIAGGGYAALALLEGGKVEAWGSNRHGELGNVEVEGNTGTPVEVTGLTEVEAIAAGYFFSMALKKSGQVMTWGEDSLGQLGTGAAAPETCIFVGEVPCSRHPLEVPEAKSVDHIAAGYASGYALTPGSFFEPTYRILGWGDGEGVGTVGSQNAPILLEDFGAKLGVSGGQDFVLAYGSPLPTVASISASSGESPGGNEITITGTHLSGALAVKFGKTAGTIVGEPTETTIKVKVPAHSPATVDVRVTTSGGISPPVTADRYTYLPGEKDTIGTCTKVSGTGNYKNSACTEALAGGNWKWSTSLAKPGFTGVPIESGTPPEKAETAIEAVGGAKIKCAGNSLTGEYAPPKQVKKVALVLTGCKLVSSGAECTSFGAASSGEIVSGTLEGLLGQLEPVTNKVGLELFAPGEGQIAAAECGTTAVAISGEVIGQISPLNLTRKSFNVKFKQKTGKQAFVNFNGETNTATLKMKMGEAAAEVAGLALEDQLTNEEEVEINTVI